MIENLKKKAFQLFLGISLKRRLFITYLLLSSLILMLTSVFLYCIQKSTDQACRTFQPAAAIPDHQQPWRKDRSYIKLCHHPFHQQQYRRCFKRKPHSSRKHTGTFSGKFRTYRPGPAYHRTSQKHLCLGYPGYRKPLVSQQYHRNRSA